MTTGLDWITGTTGDWITSGLVENSTDLIPDDLIDAEEDPCGFDLSAGYDQPLHIGALFIILACSFLGTMLPIVAKRFPVLRVRDSIFSCGKMFGSGVILATALVHMLSPAEQTLTSPCLPAVFTEDYTAFAGAIAMAAILIVHAIQFAATKYIKQRQQSQLGASLPETASQATLSGGETNAGDHEHDKTCEKACDDTHVHGVLLQDQDRQISAYILEIGIASHSIIIGIALGVAREPEFTALLIALAFHQFFEGIALSTVILESSFTRSRATIFMVIFYTLTTPIGTAIGIGLNETFNANSVDGLVTIGVLDSLSAGILLYDGLVNVITPHFRSKQFENATTLSQVLQFGFLWLGAAGMALIGRWA
eukprot:TRINITY_DN26678_c0_g1_i1.p1 TRINITY_DN26678_c0_g1~~TRINITY_DN26678_c0_g1_i1.p1  ORF type:complete len:394 (-),score=106.31 TRINITY_DN26678_c0_g1_i1:793-1893(-)